MSYDKRRVQMTTTGTTGSVTFPVASDVVEVIGFRCLSTGDTSTRVKLTDGDGRIFFLDAGDINYTAQKDTLIAVDDTVTGLTLTALADSTGAAATIAGGDGVAAKSPITLDWSNGTSGDVVTFDLYYRWPLYKTSTTLTVPNPAATATATVNLRTKFAQIVGFSALQTGADTATRIQIADADSRVVYLDAADKDYTARKHRVPLTYDDTLTGLTPQQLDATGVAATATSAAPKPVVKTPLTVSWSNNGTAAETLALDIYYRA